MPIGRPAVPAEETDPLLEALREYAAARRAWDTLRAQAGARLSPLAGSLLREAARHDLRMAQGRLALETAALDREARRRREAQPAAPR